MRASTERAMIAFRVKPSTLLRFRPIFSVITYNSRHRGSRAMGVILHSIPRSVTSRDA